MGIPSDFTESAEPSYLLLEAILARGVVLQNSLCEPTDTVCGDEAAVPKDSLERGE